MVVGYRSIPAGNERDDEVGGIFVINLMTVQAQLQDFASKIAEKYSPQEIILFGSHARGEAQSASDVDLLVILSLIHI